MLGSTHLDAAACGILTTLMILGCAPRASGPPVARTDAAPLPRAYRYPVIVRLISRQHTITVPAGPRAPSFTILTASGDVLAENRTLADVR